MEALSGAPAHVLLQRKDNANSHSIEKGGGFSSAFAAYGFGPLDTKHAATDDKKPITGSSTGARGALSVNMLTQLSQSAHKK